MCHIEDTLFFGLACYGLPQPACAPMDRASSFMTKNAGGLFPLSWRSPRLPLDFRLSIIPLSAASHTTLSHRIYFGMQYDSYTTHNKTSSSDSVFLKVLTAPYLPVSVNTVSSNVASSSSSTSPKNAYQLILYPRFKCSSRMEGPLLSVDGTVFTVNGTLHYSDSSIPLDLNFI